MTDGLWKDDGRLVDLLPVGILKTDLHGRCLYLNPQAEAVLGIPREDALAEGWLGPLEEASREALRREWERSAPSASPFSLVLRIPGTDGAGRVLSCRVVPFPGDGAPPAGYLATLLDVTDGHGTEEDLRTTTRELAFRVRELDCLFGISRAVERSHGDLGAILREAVGILSQTWGHPRPACARITLEGHVQETPDFNPCPRTRRVKLFVHGEEAGAIEVGLPGSESPADFGLSPMEEERLLEAVAQRLGRTAERLRGSRLLREKEEEMRERLTHLTRVSILGEMASSIAHEVNQPLTAVATYAQACVRLVDAGEAGLPEVMEVLGRIGEEALRAGNIVHRLKDLVRRQETRWTECDLNDLIRDVELLASVDARLHDVDLRFELTPDLPRILADAVQVQQVVLNLIRNGIDAVEGSDAPEGAVVVRTGPQGSRWVAVMVDDDGCGLPPELDDRMFEPFFTTKREGMGMGLSISKSIAHSHRGRITFERNPSRGMTFKFILPTLDEG